MEKDLKTFIKSFEGDINMNIIKGIMKRILQGLSYLHLQGIFHRDLKPQNIMINTNDHKLEVKIVDFGLARTYSMIERDYTINSSNLILLTLLVTPLYRAPEVFLGISNYSAEVDMWSVGCIFAELLLKSPLFIGQQEMDVITRILRLFGVFSIDVLGLDRILSNVVENSVWEELFPMLDKDGIDLISRMLILDPKKRIKADEAIEHSFFKDVQ